MRAAPTFLALLLAAPAAARAQAPLLLPALRPGLGEVPLLGPAAPVRPPVSAGRVFALAPSSPARAAAEQALLEAAVAVLMTTGEGSRILSELAARGRPIPLSFIPTPGSVLGRGSSGQEILGVSGSYVRADGAMRLNELYLAMADPARAKTLLALTLAHECEHARLHAQVAAIAPWFSTVLTIDAANERNAFLSEFLVAAELGAATDELASARTFLADPPAYWEKKRLGGALYALALTLDEMRDPVTAWTGRLAKLKVKLAETEEELGSDIPRAQRALAHMERAHAYPVADLREDITADAAFLTGNVDKLKDSVEFLEERIAKYSDPAELKALTDALAIATGSPSYRAVTELVASKAARLSAGMPAVLPAAPSAASGPEWKEFYRAVDRDRAAHPEHWDPTTREPIGLGPTWKSLVAELTAATRG